MREPDEFDQFYKDVRSRTLLLTYCLTGDLASSRTAVRDAFIVAWHHWRKVSRLEDPEAWVRERACRGAQRRHTAKLWHREKGLDPETKATLDALGRLSMTQRRVLLVTELTSTSLSDMAREVGLPRVEAERALQGATSSFTLHREISSSRVRSTLEAVRGHVDDTRWPRPTILRRAGATRRRTHTVIGVAATAAALVVTGAIVTDADGVRPTLADERLDAGGSASPTAAPQIELSDDTLLGVEQVSALDTKADWTVGTTGGNTSGDGLVMTCQQSRYAAPRQPDDALVRTFSADRRGPGATPRVVQTVEAARAERGANRAYDGAVGWFAGCADDRAQLLETYDLPTVGDEATLFELRTWKDPGATVLAGVARTGQLTTVTSTSVRGDGGPGPKAVARLLAASVNKLCALPEAGACATELRPRPRSIDPIPAAQAPGMLAEVDLPPVRGLRQPWVGTEPRKALDNAASTNCDGSAFTAPMTNNLTRTFLVPAAKLPDEFGLTESVGTLPPAKAKAFVSGVRDKLATCSKKHMGTEVTRLSSVTTRRTDLTVWRVETEVTDDKTISFLMGIARDRGAVAQVGFVPTKGLTIDQQGFEALTRRALDRLGAMAGTS
jgi:DNA-directed RNA polymerase specialized sigma24 family protein